jgi:hypothetical protein
MPHKPQLPEATALMEPKILAALTSRPASPATIRKKMGGNVVISAHLKRLVQFGRILEKDGKYCKLLPESGKTVKKVAKAIAVTEASVKADLDLAIQQGNVAVIGELLVKVFDSFIHPKSPEFFQLRYMANWCRTKQLSGAYISKAYTLLVGHFMPFVLKLRNGEVEIDMERDFTVSFTDDAAVSHMTTVKAISPSRAIVEVRKSQRNGFHLHSVMEA